MDIARARYLVSPDGRSALAAFDGLDTVDPVALSKELRRELGAFEAAAVAEQLTLRARAEPRLGDAARTMSFTREGLEMMSHPLVAERRARRLADAAVAVDLTCGIGGDLRMLSRPGVVACGLEIDQATAILAAANVPGAHVAVGDATRAPFSLAAAAMTIDPARRDGGGRRTFDPETFSPAWGVCLGLAREARRAAVKGPPGIPHAWLPTDAETEFVQVGRSMREATLWFGPDVAGDVRRAVLLPSGATLDSSEHANPPYSEPPSDFIIDPESCVTRAGVVRQLAFIMDASMMDTSVAYLTSHDPDFSPLGATFRVLDRIDFGVNRLRTRLRERGWRPDEIRRRAFPIEPDELRRLIGRIEGEPVTLLCTTLDGKRVVFVGRRATDEENCATV